MAIVLVRAIREVEFGDIGAKADELKVQVQEPVGCSNGLERHKPWIDRKYKYIVAACVAKGKSKRRLRGDKMNAPKTRRAN